MQDSRHVLNLDGLRGVAAASVVATHAALSLGRPEMIAPAYLSVDLFFVLSGYVLGKAYDDRLGEGMSRRHFMTMRLIRLWPMLFLGLLLGASLKLLKFFSAHSGMTPTDVLLAAPFAALMLPNPLSPTPYPLLFPTFTLTCEMAANILFAYWHRGIFGLPLTLILATSAGAVVLAVALLGSVDEGMHWPWIWVGLARVGFSFFVGLIIYRSRKTYAGAFSTISPIIIYVVFLGFLLIPCHGWLVAPRDLIFVLVVSPILVAIGACAAPLPGTNPLLRFLGNSSYPAYIIHWPLALRLGGLGTAVRGHEVPVVALFTCLVLCLGFFLDRLVDRPVRRWLSSHLETR